MVSRLGETTFLPAPVPLYPRLLSQVTRNRYGTDKSGIATEYAHRSLPY
jgi:hypothetical protein